MQVYVTLCPYIYTRVCARLKKASIWIFSKGGVIQGLPLSLFSLNRLLRILISSNSDYLVFEEQDRVLEMGIFSGIICVQIIFRY